jgi:hypothetical protein
VLFFCVHRPNVLKSLCELARNSETGQYHITRCNLAVGSATLRSSAVHIASVSVKNSQSPLAHGLIIAACQNCGTLLCSMWATATLYAYTSPLNYFSTATPTLAIHSFTLLCTAMPTLFSHSFSLSNYGTATPTGTCMSTLSSHSFFFLSFMVRLRQHPSSLIEYGNAYAHEAFLFSLWLPVVRHRLLITSYVCTAMPTLTIHSLKICLPFGTADAIIYPRVRPHCHDNQS